MNKFNSNLIIKAINRLKFIIPISIILAIIIGIIVYNKISTKPKNYTANALLFPISGKEENNPTLSLIKNMSGNSSSDNSGKIYNLNELIKSKTIRNEIVSTTVNFNNKNGMLADFIILDDHNPKSYDTKYLSKFTYEEKINLSSDILLTNFSLVQNKSEFVNISYKSHNEDLSILADNVILNTLSKFYVKYNSIDLTNNLFLVKKIRDSLFYELNRFENAYAQYLDENKYINNSKNRIPDSRFQRKIELLQQDYTLMNANYQNIKSEYNSLKPILKILDYPSKPTTVEDFKEGLYSKLAGFLSFFVFLILLNMDLFFKFIKNAIRKQKEKLINPES